MNQQPTDERTFIKRSFIFVAITFLFLTVFLILKAGFGVVLLILAGILVAAWFRGMSYWLAEKTKLNDIWSLVIVTVGTFGILTLTIWLLGSEISQQFSQLQKDIPALVDQARQQIKSTNWGGKALGYFNDFANGMKGNKVASIAKTFFKTTFGIIGDIYVILLLGMFFSINPQLYKDGIVALVPKGHKKRAGEILVKLGVTLRSWLTGKVFAMIVIAILSYIALKIIGIPMALALAVIAGLLNFIPNFGPILALIPAVLVAIPEGWTKVLLVVILYTGIQILESSFITPAIQKKLVRIPPALIVIGQLFMGVLTGALGLILATPLVAMIMVLVQETYVKENEEQSAESERVT